VPDPTADVLNAISGDLAPGYELVLNSDSPPQPGWVALDAHTPDGRALQLAWLLPGPGRLFDALRTAQGELIEHELGEAWPRCPTHGTHPLKPEQDGWHCPVGDGGPWPYGSLADVLVAPAPHREDGVVRWWANDLGWGVVADHEGDVWVHFSAIEAEGYRSLTEGEKVEYRVRTGMHGEVRQGVFRQAEWVRRSTLTGGSP
jgi:CspA family cold shock protein